MAECWTPSGGSGVIFDLGSERWISVVDLDGVTRDVGLADVLLEAHALRRIVGETPPMTGALYRLVLALAHRVFGPEDSAAWAALWGAERFPVDRVRDYFGRWAGRFDLFDPTRPFLQCQDVAATPPTSVAKLVPHRASGNNTTLFDHTTARDTVLLGPAAAARWLVTVQAYDPGGLKTPYLNDKSSQIAPCNGFGLVLVEGATLRETILLNLQRYDPEGEKPHTTTVADCPMWEADDPPEPVVKQRHPRGWTDLLTWPSRRVWLSRRPGDELAVDGVVITPGTRLLAELHPHEWMAAFWRPAPRGKAVKVPPLLPVRLQAGRGVWRHTQELLLASSRRNPERGAVRRQSGTLERRRPHTLDHVAEMAELGYIPDDTMYTLRVFGQQLDRNGGISQAVMEETVAAPVALMRARDSRVGRIIGFGVQLADELGAELRRMDREYRATFRAEPSMDLDLAYWPALPAPFDDFLRALATAINGGHSEFPAARAWADTVRRTAHRAAHLWAYGSPRRGRNLLVAGQCYERFTGLERHLTSTYRSNVAANVQQEEAA
jgi:CRISPR system Cascade subunit CasA